MATCGAKSEGRECVLEEAHYGPVHVDDTHTAWWDDELPIADETPELVPLTDPDDDRSM